MATTRSNSSPPPSAPRPSTPAGPSSKTPDRGGRGKRQRRKPSIWRKIGAFFQFIFLLILISAIACMAGIFWFVRQEPKTIDLTYNPPGITMIYSSDGTPLAKYFVENRLQVSIDQIPKDLQNATVSFEDRRFWTRNTGIDFTGIGRALWVNLRHGDLKGEGGSTITQQLARNLGVEGLTREKSFERKLKELLIANQIEHSYSKQWILEKYLNEVNYGSGAYGVEAAAKTYFGKHVKDLDLAECALLAGLPNRPTYFNPYLHKDLAEKQRNIVLDWMLEEKYITPQQCADAKAEPIKLASPHPPKQGSRIYHAPYFVSYVYQQLKDRYGEEYLNDGNIKVYTTLNWPMQQVAEEAVKEGLDDPEVRGPRGPSQACLVALDPKTGEIKAMVGGRDYSKSQYNIATMARRQPGSLFKAILYSAAIDSGLVTEDTTVPDVPITFHMPGGEDWTPKDDTRPSYRRVTLREAMAMSINIPAARVMSMIKPPTVVQYARLMGIKSPLDPVLSLALGSSAVTPLEITDAYATFPNGGIHMDPVAFTTVENADGDVLDSLGPQRGSKVISPDTNQQLDDMLRAVATEGTGIKVSEDPAVPDAHGKTGTTQDHKDAWFVGYTPHLVCGVWAGHPTTDKHGNPLYGEPMAGNAWGATLCVPIWKNFMLKAEPIFINYEAKEAAKWKNHKGPAGQTASTDNQNSSGDHTDKNGDNSTASRPHRRKTREDFIVHNSDGTVTVNIDNDTGLIAPPGAPNSQPVNFADGQEPKEMAPQYANQVDDSATPSTSPSTPSSSHAPAAPSTTSPGNGPGTGNTPTTGDSAGQTNTDNTSTDTQSGAVDTPIDGTPSSTPSTTPASNSPILGNAEHSRNNASPPAQPAPRRHPRVHRPKPKEYVTVYINPDDGLLATEYTPYKIAKTYVKGTEPKKYTPMYPPPPGEP